MCLFPGLLLNVAFKESTTCLGDTKSEIDICDLLYPCYVTCLAFNVHVILLNIFFEIPQSDKAQNTGHNIESHCSSKHTNKATRVIQKCSQGKSNKVREVPHYTHCLKSDKSVPEKEQKKFDEENIVVCWYVFLFVF